MLTLIGQPNYITFSKNEVIYKLRATDDQAQPYGATGVSAKVTMNQDGLSDGDTLSITWVEPDGSSQTVNILAKNNPQGNELQAKTTAFSPGVYFQLIANQISQHPRISPFFSIDTRISSVYSIIATTIAVTDDWSVEWDVTNVSSSANATVDTSENVADNTPDNYQIKFDVFFEHGYQSGIYRKVSSNTSVPDADGIFEINIEDILHSEGRLNEANPPIPTFNNNQPLIADNLRRYYVRYREQYNSIFEDNNTQTGEWIVLSEKKVLIGGISQTLFARYDFFNSIDATKSLLTWYPSGKMISPNQPEYLHYYNITPYDATFDVEITPYTEDGALPAFRRYHNVLTLGIHQTALLPVGYNQIDFSDQNITKTILKYDVQVVFFDFDSIPASTTPLSPKRTYYVDHKYYEEKRYVVYMNGFGCPETLRCVGQFTKNLKLKRTILNQIVPANYDDSATNRQQSSVDYENYFTYRSGWIGRLEVDALQELLIYNEAWEVYDTGYLALLITDKKFKITETRQFLHSVQFIATPKLKQKNYSNEIAVDEDSDGWETVTDFWRVALGAKWETA